MTGKKKNFLKKILSLNLFKTRSFIIPRINVNKNVLVSFITLLVNIHTYKKYGLF